MKTITLYLDKNNSLHHIKASHQNTSGIALLRTSLQFLHTISTALATQFPDEESRKLIYDQLVLATSETINEVYPENLELKGSPEDFLAHLEEKVRELNAKK